MESLLTTAAPRAEEAMLVDYVIHGFVKGGSVQKGSRPGFAHALKLSYPRMEPSRLSVTPHDKTLTYRYPLSSHQEAPTTVGLLTALMDELSTTACFAVGQPSAPGVSLQMQTELVETASLSLTNLSTQEVDVVNIVTKLGRTVSTTRTEFRHVSNGELLAFSSHVKYMPTGSLFLDWILSNKFLYSIYQRFFVTPVQVPLYEHKSLPDQVIGGSLEPVRVGHAKFQVTAEHTNPFGGLHGGCHAMVMERVATSFAQQEFNNNNNKSVVLQAMQIDFLRAVRRGSTVDVTCERIGPPEKTSSSSSSSTLQVRVFLQNGGKICSEGKLRFVAT